MPQNVIKGAYKEGGVVASVVQKDGEAKILVKGIEPKGPDDAAFVGELKKVADGCRDHLKDFKEREICAVLVHDPASAEHVNLSADQIQELGLTRVSVMDGNCGLTIRVCEAAPPATPLAFASLVGGGDLAPQPGLVSIPPEHARKAYKDLTDPQKKVYEAAVQVMSEWLVQLVCISHDGLKLVATVRDSPPARAHSVLVPLGTLADQFSNGTALEEIGNRLHSLRGTA